MHKQQKDGSMMTSLGVKAKKTPSKKKKKRVNKNRLGFFLVLLVILSFGGGFIYKITRPLEVKIGSVTVNQKNYQKVSSILTNFDQQEVLLVDGELEQKVKLAELGAEINQQQIKTSLSGFEKPTWVDRLSFKTKKVTTKFEIGADRANQKLDPIFLKDKQVVLEPKPVYDSKAKKFVVQAGHPGQRIDLKTTFADGFSFDPNKMNQYQVKYISQEPKISQAEAQKTADYINQRLNIRVNLRNKGRQLYFPDPWDIADWARITIAKDGISYQVDFDKAAIEKFLNTTVMKSVNRAPVNKLILNDKDGKFIAVLREGRRGFKATNADSAVTDGIKQALLDKKSTNLELALVESDFKTEIMTTDQNDKWIEVDLSDQTTTMWIGSQKLQSFLVSTGLSAPTPPGTYRVWHKTAIQDMVGGSRARGTYYNLKNVHWNTFFTYSGIGFHEAYWHNNFGHPMSHGCVNMRLAHAKIIYDFAPLGTKVVVHQ